MDAGAIGIVGGTGIILFLAVSLVSYENRHRILRCCRNRYQKRQQEKQQMIPLLPLVVVNPMGVRSASKQWKVKELVEKK